MSPHSHHKRCRLANFFLSVAIVTIALNFAFIWYAVERDLWVPYRHLNYHEFMLTRQKTSLLSNRHTTFPPNAPTEISVHQNENNGHDKNAELKLLQNQSQTIANILQKAGIPLPPNQPILPTWNNITQQYGPHPILRNIQSACPAFRTNNPISQRMIGVAGLFNTGTNYLANLLEKNCHIPNRSSTDANYPFREQVPYGKHNPPSTHRMIHTARRQEGVGNHSWVLPVVIIKDPYHWMVSNCRHAYFLYENDKDHCPNVVDWNNTKEKIPTSFSVPYAKEKRRYSSLVHLWNSWYQEYEQQSALYPVIFIRFEDLLFYSEYVIRELCGCIGGEPPRNLGGFHFLEESAKKVGAHAGANGFLDALLRYGNPDKRLEGWTIRDWEYARDYLDRNLMEKFSYRFPSMSF